MEEEEVEAEAEDHHYAESLPSESSGDSKPEFSFPPEIFEPKNDLPIDPVFDEGDVVSQAFKNVSNKSSFRGGEHNIKLHSQRRG